MAVYTKLNAKQAAAIAARWKLGEPTEFVGVPKGSVNTNYRMVTPKGTWFVRLDETRDRKALEEETALLSHFAQRRFPTPEALPDKSGKRVGELDGKPLTVFPWMPGRDKDAEEYTRSELAEAGVMLARLHRVSEGYPKTLPNRFSRASIAARWARIRDKADVPKTEKAEIDAVVASFTRTPPPPGPVGIVHGDWFADNLLFEGPSIVAVLDFEAAATEHLTFDVATAVNALCWLKKKPDTFDRKRVAALLDGYERANGPAELDQATLEYWLRATALRFTVTRIQDFRLKRSTLRVEKNYRDFLRRLRWWTR